MCGRTASYRPPEVLADVFEARAEPRLLREWEAGYNVAPTSPVVGLALAADGGRALDLYRWGLVPSWAPDVAFGNRLFNARAETLWTKPAYGAAARTRRLAVIVDGFFEWRTAPDGRRRPLYFTRADGRPFAFAGVWETWTGPGTDADNPLLSTTIVTCRAGADLDGIHDRMPVVLDDAGLEAWLDPASSRPDLEAVLAPSPAATLVHHPVDARVGNVAHDDPGLLAVAEVDDGAGDAPEPLRLFG